LPKSKSAQKAARAAERRQLRNKSIRSAAKTRVTQAEKLILSNEPESAQQAVGTAIRVLDKAAQKGTIHPNTTARRKSRLMRKLNQAALLGSDKPKATDSDTAEE